MAGLPITVNEVSASLDAAPSADAGAEISITWSGPDNRNDFITVVPDGAEAGSYLKYTYTRKGSPLKVRMPDEPGQYELRYLTGQSNATLAGLPIAITEVTATLNALPAVSVDAPLQVAWTGPTNKNDYIAIAKTGSPDSKQVVYVYTRKGSPAKFKAPKEPGQYELRYVMGQSKRVLARLPLAVQ